MGFNKPPEIKKDNLVEVESLSKELSEELTDFTENAMKETKSGLGYVMWLGQFEAEEQSINERIRKIKLLRPDFMLGKVDKEKLDGLRILKNKIQEIKDKINTSPDTMSAGLLGDKMKKE